MKTTHSMFVKTLMFSFLAVALNAQAAAKSSASAKVSASAAPVRSASKASLLFGGGFTDIYGYWGMALRLGAEFRIGDLPLLAGAESGLMFGFGGTAVPILATATYELQDLSTRRFQTRFGVSLGPIVHVGRGLNFWYDDYDYSRVSLALLTRPGCQFNISEAMALNLEVAIGGTLGGIFIFSPQATFVVKI